MESSVSSYSSSLPGPPPPAWVNRNGYGMPSATSPSGTAEESSTGDRVDLSPEAREAAQKASDSNGSTEERRPAASSDNEANLTPEELQQLQDLKARDREVRTHEQAHLSAAGQYAAGSASFTFQLGPDGSRYAVGGEVPIDISKAATPEETIQKMETVRSAALAPAEPSAADRQIAAQAAMTAAQARQEVVTANQEQQVAPDGVDAEQENETEQDGGATVEPPAPRHSPNGVTVTTMINAYTAMQTLG